MPTSAVVLIVVGAALLAVIPFIPGWIELWRPRDDKPLRIDRDYQKNHFFFGDSFHALLKKGMPEALPQGHSHHRIALSRPEEIHAISAPEWEGTRSDKGAILYLDGNLNAGQKSVFGREVFVAGNATIGDGSHARAILCQGNLALGKNSRIVRWLDVRGDSLITGPACKLGRSTACKGLLHLALGTSFVNLHGFPIRTYARRAEVPAGPAARKTEAPAESADHTGDLSETCFVAAPDLLSLPARTQIRSNIVSRQKIRLSAGCEVFGDVKSYAGIELEAGATVHGAIMAEGDVHVGPGCRVLGNIFSQGGIVIQAGSVVGIEGSLRSVVCRKTLVLHGDVSIHGSVSCAKGYVA